MAGVPFFEVGAGAEGAARTGEDAGAEMRLGIIPRVEVGEGEVGGGWDGV